MAQALEGVRVLDLATFVAAPVCATLLGEFGAEVIKVEQPGVGDDLRRLGRQVDGVSLWWLTEARNKKSITCNLRMPAGQALIRRLLRDIDIVTENFRPGTLERWNLSYDDLRRDYPSLIMVRISAFGQTGPYRERPGFGRIAAAVGGLSYLSGDPDRPPATPGTPTIPDYLAGVMGAFGALLALRHRERTGDGQMVDLALYEPILRMLDELIPVYGATGHVRERIGSGTEYVVPHNHYRARDNHWVAIACTNERMFERFAQAMGRPDLTTDPRFRTMADRVANRTEMDQLVQEWVGQREAKLLLTLLEGAAVPASLVYSVRDLFEDPHMEARENIVPFIEPILGTLHMPNVVPKLSLTPGRIIHTGPRTPGEHNEEIYIGKLGLTRERLAVLKDQGVI